MKVQLFMRNRADFMAELSKKFIEQGNFPSGFKSPIEAPEGSLDLSKPVNVILEEAYEKGQNDFDDNIFAHSGRIRSMSIGDVIEVEHNYGLKKYYMVDDIGFISISP